MQNESLSQEQKKAIREGIIENCNKLFHADPPVIYQFGAEWTNYAIIPKFLDCSEMPEGVFTIQRLKLPDGSQNQYDFTIPTTTPQPGDLAFFGRGGKRSQIYHVGIVYDEKQIIEVRAFDPNEKRFKTGKIILRPTVNWMNYSNFVGFTCHPKLLP